MPKSTGFGSFRNATHKAAQNHRVVYGLNVTGLEVGFPVFSVPAFFLQLAILCLDRAPVSKPVINELAAFVIF